jgi:DNA mismatch repair protein MutS2
MTIRVIQENKADKVKTGQARANLHKFKEKVEKTVTEVKPAEPAIKKPQVQVKWLPGMLVKNVGSDTVGEVLEVKKDKLKVVFGLVQVWMPVAELEPATEVKKGEKRKSGGGFNWVDRNAAFSPHLDVRGQSAEDAMNKVRNWLDEAYALGQFHLKLIHGRGDGILRKVLREYFKTLPYMRSYRSEREEHGGDGCTVIELM